MLLLILALSIIGAVVGLVIKNHPKSHTMYEAGDVVVCMFIVVLVITLVIVLVMGIIVSSYSVIDEKLTMYQEENTKIEQQIATIVKEYQEYEKDIFEEVPPEDAMTMVTLYPELKSNILVQTQIQVHAENNAKIKELREQQIDGSVLRWWLYFGG